MKRLLILGVVAIVSLFIETHALAADSPHNDRYWSAVVPINCGSCHLIHKAPGTSLTSYASNYNLCLSCHNDSGTASAKRINATMQSVPGTSGTSHRWNAAMPTTDSPSNQYGLRPTANLSNADLIYRLNNFGNVVTCSVCHNQHSQEKTSWNPYSGAYTGLKGGDSGAATSNGTTTAINDSNKSAYWTNNVWAGFYVKMRSGTTANIGQIRQIQSNNPTQLIVSSPFPTATLSGDGYEIIGRDFQRASNDLDDLCEDCHYYRVQTYTRVEGNDPLYPPNGTNVFSHPVGQALNSNGQNYDRTAPLDVNGIAQSGGRFTTGGENPDNTTNNLVVETSTNKVRCLTCHRIHYTDSNSLTIDLP